MKARSLSAIAALPLLIGLLCPSSASALVVDWDTLAWNPGDLATSYEIDSGAAGNDVTVAVTSQNNNTLTTDSTTGIQTPNIGNAVTGGLAQNSFEIAGNLHTNSNVTLTISFNPAYVLGSSNVSFTIFDIDVTTNPDIIDTIYGLAPDGVTHVAPTISNLGANVNLTGTGLAQVLTGTAGSPNSGAGSGAGNATITFNSPVIGFSFIFGNGSGAPRYQDIAVSDIFFIPIPEMNSAVPVLAVALAASAFAQLRRNRRSAVAGRHTLADSVSGN